MRVRDDRMQLAAGLMQPAIDALSAHIAVLDPDGTIVAVNGRWRAFGEDNGLQLANHAVGCNYFTAAHHGAGDAQDGPHPRVLLDGLRAVLEGRQDEFLALYPCHSDQIRRWFNLRVSPLFLDRVRHVLVAHENVTPLIEATEALRESEARFRNIADSVPVFIYMLRPDGSLEFINKPLRDYHGMTLDELRGDGISAPLHPDDIAPSAAAFVPAFQSPRPVSVEHRMRGANGEYRWFLNQAVPRFAANGQYAGYIGCCSDVHERKLAERAVEASERRYRSIFHTAAVAMWQCDFTRAKEALDALKAQGVTDLRGYLHSHPQVVADCVALVTTRGVNDAAVRLAGADSREHLRANFLKLFEPQTLHEFADELADLAEERGEHQRETTIRTLRGELRRCMVTVSLPPLAAVDSVLAAVSDVTERREAEALLQALNTRLLHAQEEERRRLAREMHDDVTQRLAMLAIEAGRLQHEAQGTSIASSLQHIAEQIGRLSGDVHAISRQLHPSILDDLGLVEAIEAECRAFTDREGIAVTFNAAPIERPPSNDLSLCLYRIFQEGLRNVAKHAQTDRVDVTLTADGDALRLRMQDRGVGFDPSQRRNTPGLGLASMRERAKLVSAELTVNSSPGNGVVLEVRAPLRRNG